MSLGSWLAREGGTEALPPERAGSEEPAAPAGRGAGEDTGGCSCTAVPPPAACAGTLWGCTRMCAARAGASQPPVHGGQPPCAIPGVIPSCGDEPVPWGLGPAPPVLWVLHLLLPRQALRAGWGTGPRPLQAFGATGWGRRRR